MALLLLAGPVLLPEFRGDQPGRLETPLLDLRLFRNRPFAAMIVALAAPPRPHCPIARRSARSALPRNRPRFRFKVIALIR